MTPWNNADEEWKAPPHNWLDIPRALIRMIVLLLSLLLCMIPFLLLRFGQRLFGARHMELHVLKFWGKIAIWCFGLRTKVTGEISIQGGMITANHCNFIDIPLVWSVVPGYMMSKSEIRNWPFIGWCARLIGTFFIIRDPAKTAEQVALLEHRIADGDRMVIFPEATTTDGQRIIPFRSSFFQAIAQASNSKNVQPIVFYYHAPIGASRNFFGYWGEARLLPQMWASFRSKGLKTVDIKILPPLPAGLDRKSMSQEAEQLTRQGFEELQAAYQALQSDHPL